MSIIASIVNISIGTMIQQNAWIVTILAFLYLAFGIYRCIKIRKQKEDEQDIKNMFNIDGSRSSHDSHIDYDPFPNFVFAAILFIVRILIYLA